MSEETISAPAEINAPPVAAEAVPATEVENVSVPAPAAAPATPAVPGSTEERLKLMLSYGVHFGHQTSRWNPKMAPYIFTVRNGIHIIDLLKTLALLEEAKQKVREVASRGGQILFVCTKRQGAEKIAEIANLCSMPYVNTRWIGGLFTNFKVILKRIKTMEELRRKRDAGELETMIKKERGVLMKKLARLEMLYGGIATMTRLPQMVVAIDPHREHIAVSEARKMKIPIVAMLDTNCNPDDCDYPVPANDDAIRSLNFIISELGNAVKEGVSEAVATRAAKALATKTGDEDTKDTVLLDLPDEILSLEEKEEEEAQRQLRRISKNNAQGGKSIRSAASHVVITELKSPLEPKPAPAPAPVIAPEPAPEAAPADEQEAPAPAAPEEKVAEPKIVEKARIQEPVTFASLPGLNDKTIAALKKAFKTVDKLKQASEEEISAVEGIGPATLKKVLAAIKS